MVAMVITLTVKVTITMITITFEPITIIGNRRFAYNSGIINSVNCSNEDRDQWKGKRRKTKTVI